LHEYLKEERDELGKYPGRLFLAKFIKGGTKALRKEYAGIF
jgi:hypothetical protein